jgi:phenylacetate-CoA ligase
MFLFQAIKEVILSKKVLKMSKVELRELQLNKFRKLVKYCYDNSEFYHDIIINNSINIETCIPEDFPILNKKIVNENFDKIVTDKKIRRKDIEDFLAVSKDYKERYMDKYNIIRTSGSSGEVGIYVYSDSELLPITACSNRATGTNWFQRFVYLAKIDDHYAGITMAGLSGKLPIIYSDTMMINVDEDLTTILNKLNTFKPTNLGGYSFLLAQIAKAQLKGELNIEPKYIQTGGEPSLESDKVLIKQAFPKAKLINVYACSEALFLGVGVGESPMQLMDDYIYTEINVNNIYCTNLFNYTCPLIRFQINDNLSLSSNADFSSPFTLIDNIVGRVESNPEFVNDDGIIDFISGLTFTSIVIEGMDKFQVSIRDNTSFDFTLTYKPNQDKVVVNNRVVECLNKILKDKKMTKVKYSIVEVDNISPDVTTGKYKAVVMPKK